MAGSHVLVIQKSVIKRVWLDIEPKLYAALISGSAVSALLIVLSLAHVHLSVETLTLLPLLAAEAAGYVKASTHKGDLLAKIAADGPADLRALAPAVAAAVPAIASEVDAVEQIAAALDPSAPAPAVAPIPTSGGPA